MNCDGPDDGVEEKEGSSCCCFALTGGSNATGARFVFFVTACRPDSSDALSPLQWVFLTP